MTFGWPMSRLKRLVRINEQSLPEATDPDRELRYVDIGTVGRGMLVADPEVTTFGAAPSRARRLVGPGDTIVSTVRTYLRAVWPVCGETRDLVVSTGFAVLSPGPELDGRFLGWLAQSDPVIGEVVARSVGVSYPAINATEIGDIEVAVPSLLEQRAIADYLDAETARIDGLIALKERVVRLREERRASYVASLVADDLQRQHHERELWLGTLATPWRLVPIGLLSDVFNGTTPDLVDGSDDAVAWTTSGEIDQDLITQPTGHVSESVRRERGLRIAPAGSVVVGLIGQGRTRGLSATLAIPTTLNQNVAAIVPRADCLDAAYLRAILLLAYDDLRNGGRGGNQAALNCELLSQYRIPLPPLRTQRRIAELAESARTDDERVVASLRKSTGLLLERRQSLIAAAVTGQLEIAGVAA